MRIIDSLFCKIKSLRIRTKFVKITNISLLKIHTNRITKMSHQLILVGKVLYQNFSITQVAEKQYLQKNYLKEQAKRGTKQREVSDVSNILPIGIKLQAT